jgi:hypothetical protein
MSDERKGLTGSLLKGLTRNTVEALAMKMGLKPNERGWVTLDIGASLLSVSPKVAMDFFQVRAGGLSTRGKRRSARLGRDGTQGRAQQRRRGGRFLPPLE